jgi:uncharacterized protein
MTIKLNGETQTLSPVSGFFQIKRKWKTGDIIEIKLPMNIRYESMPDDKNIIAFFFGPVLLAGELSMDDAETVAKANIAPALIPGEKPFIQWLRPASPDLEFTNTVAKPA